MGLQKNVRQGSMLNEGHLCRLASGGEEIEGLMDYVMCPRLYNVPQIEI